MVDEKARLVIYPAWARVKKETLDSFYRCNAYLNQFRASENPDDRKIFLRLFLSELIHLYLINRSTILDKTNSKLSDKEKEELKVLDKYVLEISRLPMKEAVALFLKLEDALYKLGILKVAIKEVEPEKAILEGIE